MNIKVAECCLTCRNSHFMVITQKMDNDQIYTGFSRCGRCFYRGKRSVKEYNICERYLKRDDIFSAEKIKVNRNKEK